MNEKLYTEQDDFALIRATRRGDEDAAAELVRRYTPLVRKLAWQNHVRTVADEAEDMLWTEFAAAIHSYDETLGVPPAGWFSSRLRYALWNRFKQWRRGWQRELFPGDAAEYLTATADDAATAVLHAEKIAALRAALPRLTDRQRAVLDALYRRGLSRNETAALLGCTPQAVSDTKRRALLALRAALAEWQD